MFAKQEHFARVFTRHYVQLVGSFLSCSLEEVESLQLLTSRFSQVSAQLVLDETLVTIVMVEERGLERILLALRMLLMRQSMDCRLSLWAGNGGRGGGGGEPGPIWEQLGEEAITTLVRPSEGAGGRWPIAAAFTVAQHCLAFSHTLYRMLHQRLVCLCLVNQERLIAMFIEVLAMIQGTFSSLLKVVMS